jgi:Cu/Ag efflux protein CusF
MRAPAYIARGFRSGKRFDPNLSPESPMKAPALFLVVSVGVFAASSAAYAQRTKSSTPEEPCCNITAINVAQAIATARDKAGKTFQFEVKDAALLKRLRVGQSVSADFTTGQVRIFGAQPCCGIVQQATDKAVLPGAPCCAITDLDAVTGIATAREIATGRVFRFEVKNGALLQSLKVGQKVFADFGTNKVRIHGVEPCCGIISQQQ